MVSEIKVRARVVTDIDGCMPMEEREVTITLSRTTIGFVLDGKGIFIEEDVVEKILELYNKRRDVS